MFALAKEKRISSLIADSPNDAFDVGSKAGEGQLEGGVEQDSEEAVDEADEGEDEASDIPLDDCEEEGPQERGVRVESRSIGCVIVDEMIHTLAS